MFSIPFDTQRSIIIQKPVKEVFEAVGNFNTWKSWSPWICQEPNCPVEINGSPLQVGHNQNWNGERIGIGNMQLTDLEDNKEICYDINFLKPWKSHSKVKFIFSEDSNGTKVTWTMNGTLPIFLFFLKKMMSSMIGMDYDRGLSMLKELLETGKVVTLSELQGEVKKDGFYYIGKRKKSSISEMPKIMENDFMELMSLMDKGEVDSPKNIISFYHKFDFVNGDCEFTCAYTYDEKPIKTAGLNIGKIAEHKCLQVVHTGPFKNIGNAWSTVIGYQRFKKKKANKSIPWYELYLTNPQDVSENDQKTEINIPIK